MQDRLPEELTEAVAELENHYELQKFDDRGANGYVIFAENRLTHQQVAIKFYYGPAGEAQHDEPRLLAQVVSPNVLTIFDARVVSDEWAYFVTPLCAGDLDDAIRGDIPAHDAIAIALGVCTGVSAIHAAGMLHRDLKPANIVVANGVPFIADFGSVRVVPAAAGTVPASRHSALYRPPESFDGGGYGRAGDVYQIGLVTYQLLGGQLPYDTMAYLTAQQRSKYPGLSGFAQSRLVDDRIRLLAERGRLMKFETLPPWISRRVTNLLRDMTAPDPSDRVQSVADAAAALTRVRVHTANWRRTPTGARLEGRDPPIELRERGDGLYDAFAVRSSGARRMPGGKGRPLAELVQHFSI